MHQEQPNSKSYLNQRGFLLALSAITLFFVIYLYWISLSTRDLQGVWSLDPSDKDLFGLKDYVLYIGAPENGQYTCYLLASNEKCVLYDDILDLHQEPNKEEFLVVSYGVPILPERVAVNVTKKTLEIRDLSDNSVLLVRLQRH